MRRHEHIVAGRHALGRDDLFLDGCVEQRRGVDDRTDVEVYDEGDRQEVDPKTETAEPRRVPPFVFRPGSWKLRLLAACATRDHCQTRTEK